MSIHRYVTIRCNHPGCYRDVSGAGNAAAVRAAAREVDWLTGVKGGQDFCPAHKNTGGPPPDQPVPYVPPRQRERP